MSREEPPDGYYVLVGEPREELVYVRDDESAHTGPHEDHWFPVVEEPETVEGISWTALTSQHETVQVMHGAVDVWLRMFNHLQQAFEASDDPAFDDGLRFAASLVADTLGVRRPPWAL